MPRRVLRRLDVHMREVVEGASITFVMRGLGGALKFALNVAVARLLGAEGAGLFFLALSLTTVAETVSRLGLDNVLVRFVAAGQATDDWGAVAGVYGKGLRAALVAGLVVGGLLALGSGWISRVLFGKPDLAAPLAVMTGAVPLIVLARLHGQSLKGLKRILFAQIADGVALPAFAVAGILLFGRLWHTTGAAAGYVVGAAVAAFSGVALWRRATPDLSVVGREFPSRKIVATAVPLFWVSVLNLLMQWTSTVVLGAWASAEEVGLYNIAHRTAFVVVLVLSAVNSIAAPKFSELHTRGEKEALGATVRNSARIILLVATPALAALLLFPGPILGIFGDEFRGATNLLMILSVGQFINVATGSVGFLLIMTGRERVFRNITACAAALNVTLNLLLVPGLGGLGAAWATACSLAVLNVTAAVFAWRLLGIRPVPLGLWESASVAGDPE